MNIFIIGTGLIGGSFALGVQKVFPQARVFGIDQNPAHLKQAIALGVVHQPAAFIDLAMGDLVFLALPVDAALEWLPKVLDIIPDSALVIDTGSTKKAVCELVENHGKRRNFLATHPIAGTEFSGPNAAFHGLFAGKTNIICEIERTAFRLQEKALFLFKELGMRLRYMEPKSHDRHIAYVSHLSHISSFMLGKTVIEKEKHERDIFDMAGSGFESTVRLAKSSPDMWTPILRQNKKHVLKSLEEYIRNLEQFKTLLEQDDFESVHREMQDANRIKEILNGMTS